MSTITLQPFTLSFATVLVISVDIEMTINTTYGFRAVMVIASTCSSIVPFIISYVLVDTSYLLTPIPSQTTALSTLKLTLARTLKPVSVLSSITREPSALVTDTQATAGDVMGHVPPCFSLGLTSNT